MRFTDWLLVGGFLAVGVGAFVAWVIYAVRSTKRRYQ